MTDQQMAATGRRAGGVVAEDEPLPFLSNFQDWFLSIGVIVFLTGLCVMAGSVVGGMSLGSRGLSMAIGVSAFLVLLVVSGLSLILVRRRRRVLPGIVLCLAFLGAATVLFGGAYGSLVDVEAFDGDTWSGFADLFEGAEGALPTDALLRRTARAAVSAVPTPVLVLLLGLPLTGFLASLFYYRAFRLPFASAMVALSLLSVLWIAAFLAAPYDVARFSPLLTLLFGLALLAAGIAYDARDPARVLRWSGNGFWLHFFAAPVVLWGALGIVREGTAYDFVAEMNGDIARVGDTFAAAQSVVTLLVIGGFALLSLLLNRRALVVSGLISAGTAIGVLLFKTGLGAGGVAAGTLILLGGGVLLLGIGWHGARMALLAPLPDRGVWGRIFPRTDADG